METSNADSKDVELVRRMAEAHQRLLAEVGKAIVGQGQPIETLLLGLLCRGHVLLEGVPGVGKTLMARSLAAALDLNFSRIQFTPDLMPSDITGTEVIDEDPHTGRTRLQFVQGPIFTNFLLADEINRSPPKTQAALLQAMQESQVSAGRETFTLAPPFFVVATQNPLEMEGTYPLPEAQLDRFMFQARVDYPSRSDEIAIVKGTTGRLSASIQPIMRRDDLCALQDLVRGVPIADEVVDYAVRIVAATRPAAGKLPIVQKYVSCGASPRASQCLVLGGKAKAILAGRFHVNFADIRSLVEPVMRHRILLLLSQSI
jgi:MoxR-like ATPase